MLNCVACTFVLCCITHSCLEHVYKTSTTWTDVATNLAKKGMESRSGWDVAAYYPIGHQSLQALQDNIPLRGNDWVSTYQNGIKTKKYDLTLEYDDRSTQHIEHAKKRSKAGLQACSRNIDLRANASEL